MSTTATNPFPGLRPFDPSENHLFFGRDRVVDELLVRLRRHRFLAVIGSSGCGKSSVVRAGLVPALHGGHMTAAGSSWRIAIMRPGSDPIGHLAAALNAPGVLDDGGAETSGRIFRETTLRRSARGLVDAVAQAGIDRSDNVLVIVDQFEELFRFRRQAAGREARDEALAFVKRLLGAASQQEVPVYVIITMRSDFIGDCVEYPGLPEMLNAGQYLVPRMHRSELRTTIEGPVAVAGAAIAPRLTVQLLNETGDDPDQLPVLQHALMRTWDEWARAAGGPLDLPHYEAIGTMRAALSQHAERALGDLSTAQQAIAERLFKALTDVGRGQQVVRRPATVAELAQVTAAARTDLEAVIDRYRRPGTSFLMPPADVSLDDDTVVDLSHESLIRGWDRLRGWVEEERESAAMYRRISAAARHYAAGTGGLWRTPELDLGLRWRQQSAPTTVWAQRYDADCDAALAFLEASRAARDAEVATQERARRTRLRFVSSIAVVMAAIASIALWQWHVAGRERDRANANLSVARQAVSEMLTEVGRESLADVPQMESVRAQLLARAQSFYEGFAAQTPTDEALRLETALARRSLGDVHELRGDRVQALAHYQAAREELSALAAAAPESPAYTRELAAAYNRLGEHYIGNDRAAAERSYREAIALLERLRATDPSQPDYTHELALAQNNLGIALRRFGRHNEALAILRAAIESFASLSNVRAAPHDRFRLAQAWNNLGNVEADRGDYAASTRAHERAIATLAPGIEADPAKREYLENQAKFYNNLANRLARLGRHEEALAANARAIGLLAELALPVPHLAEELANSHNSRAAVLSSLGRHEDAEAALAEAIRLLESLPAAGGGSPQLQERLGAALTNMARSRVLAGRHAEAQELLQRALPRLEGAAASASPAPSALRSLANARWVLAEAHLGNGDHRQAAHVATMVPLALPEAEYFGAAAALAARAATLAADADPEKNAQAIADYEQLAVALLGEALAKGYDATRLSATGGPFARLAPRADFRQLLKTHSAHRRSGAEE